jgi:hypothetical protein
MYSQLHPLSASDVKRSVQTFSRFQDAARMFDRLKQKKHHHLTANESIDRREHPIRQQRVPEARLSMHASTLTRANDHVQLNALWNEQNYPRNRQPPSLVSLFTEGNNGNPPFVQTKVQRIERCSVPSLTNCHFLTASNTFNTNPMLTHPSITVQKDRLVRLKYHNARQKQPSYTIHE